MEAAKSAVKNFVSGGGKDTTSIHEKVSPGVTNETVQQTRHENVTTAVDKEKHQDHYHTSVQPVHDKEVLPETHHHKMHDVQHRNVEHDDSSKVKQKLANEDAKFKNTSTRVDGGSTSSTAPTVTGEHTHHHVHENIQPVVHKQTVEPHVTHSTIPVHEVHHNAAQHHSTSALPAVSMDDFKKKGGSLTGREERHDEFVGAPRDIGRNAAIPADAQRVEKRS